MFTISLRVLKSKKIHQPQKEVVVEYLTVYYVSKLFFKFYFILLVDINWQFVKTLLSFVHYFTYNAVSLKIP